MNVTISKAILRDEYQSEKHFQGEPGSVLPANRPTLREGSRTERSGSSVDFLGLLVETDIVKLFWQ